MVAIHLIHSFTHKHMRFEEKRKNEKKVEWDYLESSWHQYDNENNIENNFCECQTGPIWERENEEWATRKKVSKQCRHKKVYDEKEELFADALLLLLSAWWWCFWFLGFILYLCKSISWRRRASLCVKLFSISWAYSLKTNSLIMKRMNSKQVEQKRDVWNFEIKWAQKTASESMCEILSSVRLSAGVE